MGLEDIKGVGETRKQILHSLGMESVGELLDRFPAGYLTAEESGEFRDGEFCALLGEFPSPPRRAFSKGGARYATAEFLTGGRKITAVWFHADYVLRAVKANVPCLLTGRVRVKGNRASILQPVCDTDTSEEILPVYRLSNKLSQKIFRKIIYNALKKFPPHSLVPESLAQTEGLSDLGESYLDLHLPCRMKGNFDDSLQRARERIELEKFYSLLMSFKVSRSSYRFPRTHRYDFSKQAFAEFRAKFPYEFTLSQKKAVNEIYADLAGEYPMNRLLQGDVGSGKTAVAACALFAAARSGLQSALVAPTEVLARQHAENFAGLFGEENVVLLTSSVTGKARGHTLERIADGRAKIVVGTHSILQSGVRYAKLALAVIDEQHKFGVSERAKLVEKGENCDVLVMSATPIPRTLSLLFYNDLDVSVLREKPAERGEVKNFIVRRRKRDEMFRYFAARAAEGEQVFVVCPSVDFDEEFGAEAVKSLFEELQKKFPELPMGCLYGSMKEEEKRRAISDFRAGRTRVLVSTTVIEVGVDVPSANYMAIMNADRFGLAQLHQLRGRIGRGRGDAYCYFYTESENERGIERLEFLKGTNDGFEISEKDFELRGPGDYFGESQSGFGKTFVKMDLKLYERAKELSDKTELDGAFLERYREICRERNLEFPSVVLN